MGRRAVEIVIQLLGVLAVIAFGIGEPEQPLLEDRIAMVPQCDGEAEQQPIVANAADPVLAPAIGARARLIVRKILPGGAVLAVILAHRSH